MEQEVLYHSCPLCEFQKHKELLVRRHSALMFSDGMIRTGNIQKTMCLRCGLVWNNDVEDGLDIYDYYTTEYSLNVEEEEEHYYIRNGKVEPRSQVIYDTWIKDAISWENVSEIFEIGCGKGSLLNVITASHTHIGGGGIDGNIDAVKIANERGLNVTHGFIDEGFATDKTYDVVIAIGVIEHVIDPKLFLDKVYELLSDNGHAIIACPDATSFSYDIFFGDHLYHFTPMHLAYMFERRGIGVRKSIVNHSSLPNFQCVVGQKHKRLVHEKTIPLPLIDTRCQQAVDYYFDVFRYIDDILSRETTKTVLGYGSNELYALFLANTRLGEYLDFVLDDRPRSYTRLGFDVREPSTTSMQDHNMILLTLNEEYYDAVVGNLKKRQFRGTVVLPLQKKTITL